MNHPLLHRPRLGAAIDIVPTVEIFAVEERHEVFSSRDSTDTRHGSNEKQITRFHKNCERVTIRRLWKILVSREAGTYNKLPEKAPPEPW